MKSRRFLSAVIVIAAALMYAGCYTQFATRNPRNSYGYERGTEYVQAPADTNYTDDADSSNGEQYTDWNYPDSSGGVINNYYGYPPYNSSDYFYSSPRYYAGLYWSSPFYDPFYWDPYGLWAYTPGFLYGGFGYPYYHNLYYSGYGYGYGYGHGFRHNGYARTRANNGLRNNDGTRNGGGRNTVARNNNPAPNGSVRNTRPGSNGISRENGRTSRPSYQRPPSRYYNRGNSSYGRLNGYGQARTSPPPSSRGSYSGPSRSYSGGGRSSSSSGSSNRSSYSGGSGGSSRSSSSGSGGGSSRSSSGGGGSSSSSGGGGSRSSSGGGRGR